MKPCDSFVTITHCSTDYVNPNDPFGMVCGRRLVISGPFKKATRLGWKDDPKAEERTYAYSPQNPTPAVFADDDVSHQEFLLGNIWLNYKDHVAIHEAADAGSVYCLLMTKKGYYYGLVLLLTKASTRSSHELASLLHMTLRSSNLGLRPRK
jgi:hypothetical protein